MQEPSILSLLQKKKKFFLAILNLTQTEDRLPLKHLQSILKQKKTLLSCIQNVDQQLKRLAPSLPLTDDSREELANIRSIIETILEIDKKNYIQRQAELKNHG